MLQSGIFELDLHGMNVAQARAAIDAALRRAKSGTYRLRIIHGFSRGTALRDMVRRDYARHPKVVRLEIGLNPGETDLVLREF
ncbi:MAG: Smr/MutS family protein [Clostridiales bacterium]|nr:Smr/MutS family protein [Clostridiales bacterium]